ncbi:CBO0543 family protein [Desulfosporosinus sp. Sb-LF]|uniref:CBO0543 family protein n=1 Tax=Desulfosporosinus sp. Sb-LF TaxID=2560027 RepID=UPI00249DA6E2|nr:CBO0543 family protein [Desulfosporosinus sp. Sb-LF]
MLIRIVSVSMFLVSAYKWGDRKNWKKYYPTMCFFGMADLIYVTVFNDKPLWDFPTNFLANSLDELLLIFGCFFPTTLVFLSHYPKKLFSQIAYNSMWIGIYISLELVNLMLGTVKYYNGWNIWWSLLHNTIQFPLIALHHRNPILAWTIALIYLVVTMKILNVPFIVSQCIVARM